MRWFTWVESKVLEKDRFWPVVVDMGGRFEAE
jgi:hypothetical protein